MGRAWRHHPHSPLYFLRTRLNSPCRGCRGFQKKKRGNWMYIFSGHASRVKRRFPFHILYRVFRDQIRSRMPQTNPILQSGIINRIVFSFNKNLNNPNNKSGQLIKYNNNNRSTNFSFPLRLAFYLPFHAQHVKVSSYVMELRVIDDLTTAFWKFYHNVIIRNSVLSYDPTNHTWLICHWISIVFKWYSSTVIPRVIRSGFARFALLTPKNSFSRSILLPAKVLTVHGVWRGAKTGPAEK